MSLRPSPKGVVPLQAQFLKCAEKYDLSTEQAPNILRRNVLGTGSRSWRHPEAAARRHPACPPQGFAIQPGIPEAGSRGGVLSRNIRFRFTGCR